ncbi:bifunctional 2-polyprenyl-6-hydroxyphenol methylase/3-demethylubiquinol 3-O-methyltransferase UbiG [Kiloniella sp. EL199]|uniref:class I SAM-dependent methyltransferase n=1 Tax=Kiloniella sp. EL199 TaxID=2107581 RepID=UPI000EA0DD85|nr:class I SAM-dependent methyltransferase [Kiloniella sp. EL199]
MNEPSAWVLKHAGYIPEGSDILDLACGAGRHARLFLMSGHYVIAIDKNIDALADLENYPGAEIIQANLEDGGPFPLSEKKFGGVIVTNYLYRPLLPLLAKLLIPGGTLIYETFMIGNEKFGRPKNPDFLLKPQELLDHYHPQLRVLSYEETTITEPNPAVVQRICAVNLV